MDAAAHDSSPGAASTAPRSRRYLWALLGMLLSATVFEGYDITIFHLCTPDIARAFHMSDASVGAMATTVRFGGIMSLFVVTLADYFGRKPVLSTTVLCYGFFTLLTAMSSGVASFTIFQSAAQVFLAAEFGVAVTMISEEFPDESRARAISLLMMIAFVGVAAAGALYGHMAESRWGWRGMYMLGIAPLLLVAWLRRRMRETARFVALKAEREAHGERPGPFEPLRRCMAPMAGPWAGRMLLVAALCNCIGLVGGPTISFFSLYAKRDHHWTSAQVGGAIVAAYLTGAGGTLLSGHLLDKLGRRATAAMFFLAAAIAMATLFHSRRHQTMLLAMMATMFAYQGSRTATYSLSAELFPTGARATGFCLTVQVFGQLGWTLAPLFAGLLSVPMGGLGNAAALFAAGPVIGAILIVACVPETRGKTLEELSPETPRDNRAAASGEAR
ncbi:MAG TPA: MFS transporter [Candidatus Binataceae bacterium]|nr:MFS transporter [Candidatus Binataceae bacterium]